MDQPRRRPKAHAAVKKRLAQWLPETDAPDAPSKGAYVFDPKTYTWKRKAKPKGTPTS